MKHLSLFLLTLLIAGSVKAAEDITTLPSNLIVVSEKNDATKPFTEYVSGSANTDNAWLAKFHKTVTTASGVTYDCLHWQSPNFTLKKPVKKLVITVLQTTVNRSADEKTDGPYFNISELAIIDGNGKEVALKASDITSNAPDKSDGSIAGMLDHDISTYFHSSWHEGKAPEGYYHNLVITLPQELSTFTITMDQAWIRARLYNVPVLIRVSDYDNPFIDLQSLINQAHGIAPLCGADPGFLNGDFSAFYAALNEAKAMQDGGTGTSEERQTVADRLKEEMEKVTAADIILPSDDEEYMIVSAMPSFFYFQNRMKSLNVMQEEVLWWGNTSAGAPGQLFTFEHRGGDAETGYTYYLRNSATGKYVTRLSSKDGPNGEVWGDPYYFRLTAHPEEVRLQYLGLGQFRIEGRNASGNWGNYFLSASSHNDGVALGIPAKPGGISKSNPNGYGLYGVEAPVLPKTGSQDSPSAWYIRKVDNLPLTLKVKAGAVKTRTLHFAQGISSFLLTPNNGATVSDFALTDLFGNPLSFTVSPVGGAVQVDLPQFVESFTLAFTAGEGISQVCLSKPKATHKENLRVMTFNISKSNIEATGINTWANRVNGMHEFWERVQPDFICMQEPTKGVVEDLLKGFNNYAMVGCGRDNGVEKGEYNPVCYNSRTIRILKHGFFWLSDTPNKASRSYGSQFNRLCTWVLARDKRTAARFLLFNTHLDHTSDACREKQMTVCKAQMQQIVKQNPGLPIILTGDFNVIATLPAYDIARQQDIPLGDSWGMASKREGSGYGMVRSSRKLDYIMASREVQYDNAVIYPSVQESGLTFSDHNPQYADLSWNLTPFEEAEVVLANAQQALDNALTYTVDTKPLITNANIQLSADAVEPSEGSIAALIDGKTSTYFHSQYSGTPPNQIHWLQATLGEPVERVSLSYTRRDTSNDNGVNDRWKNFIVQASADGSSWQDVTQVYDFGHDALKPCLSSVIPLHGAYRYLRFLVVCTPGMRFANGSPMFTASEFQLYDATVNKDSPRYTDPEINALCETVRQLMQQVSDAQVQGESNTALNDDLRTAVSALEKALQTEPDGIIYLSQKAAAAAPSYYHLDGTPATPYSRGLILVVTKKADGTTVVTKRFRN